MRIYKIRLMQEIEAIREKLSLMEEELNKPDDYKHFPSKGDTYYALTPWGKIEEIFAHDNKVRPNTYKTYEEAKKAYNKTVALEKVKRRIKELQGDWEPDWSDDDERKFYIIYHYTNRSFRSVDWNITQYSTLIPYMENEQIAVTIINEMEDELKLIFDIA